MTRSKKLKILYRGKIPDSEDILEILKIFEVLQF